VFSTGIQDVAAIATALGAAFVGWQLVLTRHQLAPVVAAAVSLKGED
jgi:hypothetical protein